MVALRSFTAEDRDEVVADLARTRHDRSRFVAAHARAESEGARRSTLGKLARQIEACDRWIDRYTRELEDFAVGGFVPDGFEV